MQGQASHVLHLAGIGCAPPISAVSFMKSRSKELVEKSVAAMVAAIEVYNKPDFKYREETFSILAINAWELLLKAKWIVEHSNKVASIYVMEEKIRPNGEPYKNSKPKLTAAGNPFTHSIDWLLKKFGETGQLGNPAVTNLKALCEIRDTSIHFYSRETIFATRLQEIGSASVKNFVTAAQKWFTVDFAKYNFFLMPLAFVNGNRNRTGVLLNQEEKNLIAFISGLEAANDPNSDYTVSVSIDLKFSKSKAHDALSVQLSNDPNAPIVQFSEEEIHAKYPLTHTTLIAHCKSRYQNFKADKDFSESLKPLKTDLKYSYERKLNPLNPKTQKQRFYSEAVFSVLGRKYGPAKN
jgi:Protein of unknown function (DUF3644)/EC042_2821-lke REase